MIERKVYFFNDTATTEIYTLSLHDALPISPACKEPCTAPAAPPSDCISCTSTVSPKMFLRPAAAHSSTYSAIVDDGDRKSTRLNSSHANISYAVFCLKKNHFGTLPTHLLLP